MGTLTSMDNVCEQDNDIVNRYVSICNVALFKNAGRFPFKQILEAAEQRSRGKIVEMTIEDWPEGYTLSLSEGRISAEKHQCNDPCQCDGRWKVSKEYLHNVVENAPVYIENPARINWEWLYMG